MHGEGEDILIFSKNIRCTIALNNRSKNQIKHFKSIMRKVQLECIIKKTLNEIHCTVFNHRPGEKSKNHIKHFKSIVPGILLECIIKTLWNEIHQKIFDEEFYFLPLEIGIGYFIKYRCLSLVDIQTSSKNAF